MFEQIKAAAGRHDFLTMRSVMGCYVAPVTPVFMWNLEIDSSAATRIHRDAVSGHQGAK